VSATARRTFRMDSSGFGLSMTSAAARSSNSRYADRVKAV
jgi:hypothetical protein